ncbi:hypothetical protein ABPG75_003498 [Micractinium tetrahymenae]
MGIRLCFFADAAAVAPIFPPPLLRTPAGGQPERPAQDCQAKREGLRRQLAEAEQSAAAQAATLEEVRAQLAARCDHLTFQEEAGEQLAPAGQAGEGRHLSTENVADLSMTLLLHALMEGRQDNCQVTDPLAEKLWATEATEVSLRRQLETPNMGAAAEIVGLRKTAQAFGMQSRLTLLQIKNQDLEEEMVRGPRVRRAQVAAVSASACGQHEQLSRHGPRVPCPWVSISCLQERFKEQVCTCESMLGGGVMPGCGAAGPVCELSLYMCPSLELPFSLPTPCPLPLACLAGGAAVGRTCRAHQAERASDQRGQELAEGQDGADCARRAGRGRAGCCLAGDGGSAPGQRRPNTGGGSN